MFVNRLSPLSVYLILSGITSFSFAVFATLSAVYRIQVAGLDPLQLILIGTALELTVFLFEVPTGVVADVFSRRRSILIGVVLVGAGFVLEGLVPVFGFMVFAQVVWGVGTTFRSGATEAWISDEAGVAVAGRAFLLADLGGPDLSFLKNLIMSPESP